MAGVGHDTAEIVEHGAEGLLKMFGAFLEVLGVGDVEDALRLRPRQASTRPACATSREENVGA
jgi:hypothetical protein